jgi:hypothetical protein
MKMQPTIYERPHAKLDIDATRANDGRIFAPNVEFLLWLHIEANAYTYCDYIKQVFQHETKPLAPNYRNSSMLHLHLEAVHTTKKRV